MTEVDAIIEQREKTHGSFARVAYIAQQAKAIFASGDSFAALSASQAEAIDLICTKLSRIVNGDPNVPDHWLDTSGYAKLGADSIHEGEL